MAFLLSNLGLNWAKVEVLVPAMATINNSLFNLFIAMGLMLFLYVLFLNEACQRTEDDLHVHLETVVATVLDIQLLALLG